VRWLADCRIPYVAIGRLVGTFADPPSFLDASSFHQSMPIAYDTAFDDFISGRELGPYSERQLASNDVVNLLRQHFDQLASRRGLFRVEFASKEVGWFFADGLLQENKVVFSTPDGRRIRRVMSGKFKNLRWHACLIAKPRIWPELVYRIHMNVVLSEDGKIPMPGDKTHLRRRRLTRSWWNGVWRDRLLAAMNFLAEGQHTIRLAAGKETFAITTQPLLAEVPVSYDVVDLPLPNEEDEEGTITPTTLLDDHFDAVDEDVHEADDQEGDSP
jgi:hypothetical protein